MACAVFIAGCGGGSPHNNANRDNPTAGIAPVWPVPKDVSAKAQAVGLPMLGAEAFVRHDHAHLDVLVNAGAVTVPAGNGIDTAARTISPLHTHDTTGIIHIESPDQRPFTLGQFFGLWGIRLDRQCVDTFCSPSTPSTVYVNGMPVAGSAIAGNPADIVISRHDQISVVVGAAPTQVPAHFDFPSGN